MAYGASQEGSVIEQRDHEGGGYNNPQGIAVDAAHSGGFNSIVAAKSATAELVRFAHFAHRLPTG
jgi:hypothetical protein